MSPHLRSRAITLIVLGGLSSFGPLSMDLYLPALPRVATDLGAADNITQLSLSACLIGLALGQLIAGPLSDRWGRRKPLLIGVTGWALASLCCAVAPEIWSLIALRLVQGLAGAAGLAIARAIVRDLYDGSEVARIFALLSLVSGATPVLAPLLGSQLLRVMSWRGLFVVLGAIGAVLVWGAWWGLAESLPVDRRHTGGLRQLGNALREVSGDRTFAGAAIVLSAGGAMLFTYISLSTFVLQRQFSLTPAQFGLVFASNSVGIVGTGLLTAFALRRWLPRQVLAAGLTVALLSTLFLAAAVLFDAPLVAILAPLFLAVASVGAVFPTSTGLALQGHARNAGTASALLGVAQYLIGALAGPLASSSGASATAMSLTMLLGALCASAAFVAVLHRARRNPSESEKPERVFPVGS
jgi:DHA1 family bicyclomycin/chloramphenicol resistance-like MFS transporter